jgi:hypothetical protein
MSEQRTNENERTERERANKERTNRRMKEQLKQTNEITNVCSFNTK